MPTDISEPRATTIAKPGINSRPNAAKDKAFQLFAQGQSIKQVAEVLDRTDSTVVEYLAEYITAEKPASLAAWVPDATFTRVADACKQHGIDRLKPIFVALDQTVSYDYIRLVVTYLQLQQKLSGK